MPQGRLNSLIANLSKQKMISAKVIDVLGYTCSVRLSVTGGKLTNILYVGLMPSVGDTVLVDFREVNNPYVMTTTTQKPFGLKVRPQENQQFMKPG